MEIPALIRSKNRCLEKMIEATRRFDAELDCAGDSLSELLFHFNRTRNQFETVLKRIDSRVSVLSEQVDVARQVPEWRHELTLAFEENDRLSRVILDLDDKILTAITEKANSLSKEVNASRKTKELLGKFKSTWVSRSGEELDKTL